MKISPQIVEERQSDDGSFANRLEDVLAERAAIGFHFQPIVDLSHGAVAGYEALARFPGQPSYSPDRWFEYAGLMGRRMDLEFLTVRAALEAHLSLPPNCFLSVNVGPTFLLSEAWDAVLETRPSLGGLVVEITEQESIADYSRIKSKLAEIRQRGGMIAVDDAGAGYASLKHVIELRPNFIKLDRTFVADCHRERARAALIEMIGRTASRLDAWIIAEGVETAEEMDELIRLGVPLAQGYYLARPSAQMPSLSPEIAASIVSRNQCSGALSFATDSVPTCNSVENALDLLNGHPAADAVIVADAWGRPRELLERHPLLGIRMIAEPMKTQSDSEIIDVLLRMLAREPACRFDPVVVINGRGELAGLLRVDRLMHAAMESAEPGELCRGEKAAGERSTARSEAS